MNRCVGILAALLLAACASPHKASPARATVAISPLVNGRAIFERGRDVNGVAIVARTPPLMHSCEACHRADGAGGVHLPGGAVSADLRYKALIVDQRPRPYTQALLERAISTGIDNNGQTLNAVMPRWTLSSGDLHDVAYYVLTQLK